MRLSQVERDHGVRGRLTLAVVGMVTGDKPDVMKTVLHRPSFFGKPFTAVLDDAMRGPSRWSVGDRELFAAFVSDQNQTTFCVVNHRAFALKAKGEEVVDAVLADWQHAPVEEATRSALAFLQKLTREPERVERADIEPMRRAGLADDDIEDLIAICALFLIINAMAEALGFRVPEKRHLLKLAPLMIRRGYRV